MYKLITFSHKRAWDSFVTKHAPQSYFQSWDWGEVEKQCNRKVWRIGIKNNTRVCGASQIIKVQARRGTFLHVRNGPVFTKWDSQIFKAWLSKIITIANKERVSFIRISPLIHPSHESLLFKYSFKKAPVHKMDGEYVSVIDVQQSEQTLLKNMRKNTRYAIKKGIRDGVTVVASDDIDAFLALHEQTVKRHDFIPHQAIAREYSQFKKSNNAELLFALYRDKPIAGAIVCYYGDQAIYRHGGSMTSKIPAAYVLQWEIIKRVKKRRCQYYNLYGIADTDRRNHPWWGLSLFKNGFGGNDVSYMHAHDLPLHWTYSINYIVETIRRRKKHL